MNVFQRDLPALLAAICAGYEYDPGAGDLYDEQPINVRMTLGDYRKAMRLQYEIKAGRLGGAI